MEDFVIWPLPELSAPGCDRYAPIMILAYDVASPKVVSRGSRDTREFAFGQRPQLLIDHLLVHLSDQHDSFAYQQHAYS